ncbi:MAG: hypothetical protein HYW48_10035 [Deltaproteobacteria bacterium]|nr:hypothetical protein [Deltaproteobacteria bacterium]
MKVLKVVMMGLGLSFAGWALANSIEEADQLFFKRGEGSNDNEKFASSTRAYKAYEKLYRSASLSQEDRSYAWIQMRRLDVARGGMLEGATQKDREEVLETCVEEAEKLTSVNSKNQTAQYFRVSCAAIRGKLAGLLGRVKWALKLRGAQADALASTTVNGELVGGFEGGGILRVMSAVRGNPKARTLGLYNPEEGVDYAKRSLASPATMSRPFEKPLTGEDFYENHFYLAQAISSLGIQKNDFSLVNEAREKIVATMELMDELGEELPKGREPEHEYYYGMMKKLKGYIDECEASSSWATCLSKKYDD